MLDRENHVKINLMGKSPRNLEGGAESESMPRCFQLNLTPDFLYLLITKKLQVPALCVGIFPPVMSPMTPINVPHKICLQQ